jgi:hypothetical protein
MNAALPLLAELDETDRLLLKNLGHTETSQITIIFGALGVVVVLSFLFVFVFRKQLLRKRKRHHHHHHHHHRESVQAAPQEAQPKRRRWRRLRREHRPLNPTLAQKGGLPPLRDPDQPPAGL